MSSYKGELDARLLALRCAHDGPHLRMRRDSQAAGRAIEAQLVAPPPSGAGVCAAGRALRLGDGELLLEAVAAIRARTARGFSTRLEWIRGHSGVLGNELADRAVAAARRMLPAPPPAALRPTRVLGTALVVGGRRWAGCVRRYARQRPVGATDPRASARAGAVWHAGAPHRRAAARVADPAGALALRVAAHAVPRGAQPRSSAAWRAWGRRQLALQHCAAPTAAWMHRRGRAASPRCGRCGAANGTTLHAAAECGGSARLRCAARRALLRLERGAAAALPPHIRRTLLRELLRAPLPVALHSAALRVQLAALDARRRTAAFPMLDAAAAVLRDVLAPLWRLVAPPRAPEPTPDA